MKMSVSKSIPKWQKELNSFKGIKSTFIIEGNVHDVYPYYDENNEKKEVDFFSLNRIIANIFDSGDTSGFYDYLVCDPLFGFSDPLHFNKTPQLIDTLSKATDNFNNEIRSFNKEDNNQSNAADSKMVKNSELIRSALTLSTAQENEERKSVAVIVNFASRFLSSPEGMSINETNFFLNLLYASNNAIRGNKFINTLVLVVDKFNDIPAWFYINNPNVRTISVPNPDRSIRDAYVQRYYTIFKDDTNPEIGKKRSKYVDLTDGMKILELAELRRLCKQEMDNVEDVSDVVSIYKYGFKDNKWLQIREKIGADIKDQIRNRVKGQDQAIDKVVKVLKRSVMGLSGMQHSSDSKPRGILFLAGPTGTGKTELVKTITELLFEDERSLIRFDMSEYREENSDQKLFGAPPGYVGYGQGGQLTNAVKNNPFSVLLFDEIEKAHPSIMDKFLQILEDGRMTDGQGNTVYFTETIIFFTSNVGISYEVERNGKKVREYLVQPDEPYDDIMKKVKEAMKIEFKPEVLNRIGENIVVFNYIDENSSKAITKSKIESINKNILKSLKMNIGVSDAAFQWFFNKCWDNDTRMNGGRGIGNVIEEYYLNPLAEFLFDNNCNEGSNIFVDTQDDEITFTVR